MVDLSKTNDSKVAADTQRQYLEEARGFHDNGDFMNAIIHYTKALEVEGVGTAGIPLEHIYRLRASAWSDRGEHEIAIMDINDALRKSPQNAKLYAKRGEYHRKAAHYGKAVRDLSLAIEIDSCSSGFFYERSIAHSREGSWIAALDDIEKAIALVGDTPSDMLLSYFVQQAEIYLKTGELDKALNTCVLIQKFDRIPAEAYRVCGDVYLTMGDDIKALDMLQKAGTETNIDLSLAKIYHKKQEFGKSVLCCDQYIKLFPNSYEAYQIRGNSYYYLYLKDLDKENLTKAQRDCERAIEYYPEFIEACRTLVRVFLAMPDFIRVKYYEEKIKEIESIKRV